jgi:hypothetical protein
LPQCGAMHADAESRISFFIFFAPDCDSCPRVELFSFEIFQNSFEKFCPSVPWDPPVRHLLVVLIFLDFQAELGFQGRFLTVGSGSRFSGHPVGGKLTLIMLHQTPPMRTTLVKFLGLRTDFRVLGRFTAVGSKSSIIGPPETFP